MIATKMIRLSEVCQIKPPKKEAKGKISDSSPVSFVPMNNLGILEKDIALTEDRTLGRVYSGYTYFRDNDVLLAKITPCFENGKVGIAKGLTNGIGFGSSEYIVLRTSEHLNPEYLFYYLTQNSFREAGTRVMTGAVGHKRVPKDFIENHKIPLPAISEQKRIVAILDEAFAGIDQAIDNIKINISNVREVWRSILASASSGNLTKSWRKMNQNVETAEAQLLQSIIQNIEYQKSIGRKCKNLKNPVLPSNKALPDTWTWASPEQLSLHIVDCPHSTPKWADNGIICLRTTNFTAGHLDLSSVRFVSENTYTDRIKRLEPQSGDVLYSREGGILGISCIFPEGLKACLGQRMMLFRLNTDVVDPTYFSCVLNSPLIIEIVNQLTAGAAAPHINIRDIKGFPIPLPPFSEQKHIVTMLREISEHKRRLESIYQQKIKSLQELKQSILHKAFTGELTKDSTH